MGTDNSTENSKRPAAAAKAEATAELRTLTNFLESCSPDSAQRVSDLVFRQVTTYGSILTGLQTPEIELHCDVCEGTRRFKPDESHHISGAFDYVFAGYTCKNCGKMRKCFALAVVPDREGTSGQVQKLGENPPFGPPIPSRVMKLVGEDRELFLKGRRAELRGLGIGAFAYYRRVVQEQQGRIIEEIGKVAAKINPSNANAELFAKAKAETQFSTAVEMIKSAIPETLLIDGHNPLTLLYSALSEGIHAKSDEECLGLATSIRVVLTELAERTSIALKEEATLKSAVSRLLSRNPG